MNTVFIGGSRHVSRLNELVRERLGNVVACGHRVVVGDANGADKAVQKFLHEADYRNVIVFCSGERPRNNLGPWEVHSVTPSKQSKGFQFYAAKDREMARKADFGLMIWDGKSPGTALNILRLVQAGKKAVLVNVSKGQTTNFKAPEDWKTFVSFCNSQLVNDLRERATPEEWPAADQPELFVTAGEGDEPEHPIPASAEQGREWSSTLNKALASGEAGRILDAIGTVAKTRGMGQVAREAGLARESLYRALNADGNPEFLTVLKVIESLGLRLSVTAPAKGGRQRSRA